MSIFVTSDTHFDHRNIILHCLRLPWCEKNPDFDSSRPKNFKTNWPIILTKNGLEDHNEALIENWNERVSRGDTVVIVGDFAWARHSHFIQALKGTKIMILGNHDKMNRDSLRLFSEVHEMGCRKLWDIGIKNALGHNRKQDITFSHYAMQVWASSCHSSWMLYGHSHGRLPEWDNRLTFDVGVDVWGYAPVPMEAIITKMLQKIEMMEKMRIESGDGETAPVGKWNKSPIQRMLDIRAKNLAILTSFGLKNKYEMDANLANLCDVDPLDLSK